MRSKYFALNLLWFNLIIQNFHLTNSSILTCALKVQLSFFINQNFKNWTKSLLDNLVRVVSCKSIVEKIVASSCRREHRSCQWEKVCFIQHYSVISLTPFLIWIETFFFSLIQYSRYSRLPVKDVALSFIAYTLCSMSKSIAYRYHAAHSFV